MNAKKELFPHKTTSADLTRADGSLLRTLVGEIEAMMRRARELGVQKRETIYETADLYLQDAIDVYNNLALAAHKNDPALLEKVLEWRPVIENERRLEERLSRILRKTGVLPPEPFKPQGEQKEDPPPGLDAVKENAGNDNKIEPGGVTTMLGHGESYRPNRPRSRPRSPPRQDAFRSDRDRSPRRARSPPVTDTYHPGSRDRSPRRRSPFRHTPPRGNWRPRSPPRARSPPRRYDDIRGRGRSPRPRDERKRSRSPYDGRDRTIIRMRSPVRRISPPSGPRGGPYRGRSRSLDRHGGRIPTGPSSSNWRRRSPSPPPRESERSSAMTSGSNSRRSSPQVHPSRLAAVQQASRPRSPPMMRERSPPVQLAYRDKDSARSTPREQSPVRARSPPRGPATFRPPTGPGGGRNFTAPSPSPTISTSSTPKSVPAHNNRQDSAPVAPPAGPRAHFGAPRGGYAGKGGRGSFGHDRQGRPDTTGWGAAPSRPVNDFASRPARAFEPATRPPPASPSAPIGPSSSSVPSGPSGGVPTGPRASAGIPSRPMLQHSSSLYGGRSQSSAVSNGPRPHPAMANMAQIIPGGRIDPTASGMTTEIALRIKKREDEAEGLRADLEAKQNALRKNLKEYEKIKNESAQWALRSELSERHVRTLAGEGVGGAAF